MAKRKLPDDMIRPLTVGVVVIMIMTVIVLQFLLRDGNEERANIQPQNFSDLMNDVLPNDDQVLSSLQPQLEITAMESTEFQFAGRDSFQVNTYVSKPEGAGPFPAIILIHDAPASTRSAQRLSAAVGERLAQEQQAIVVVVDFKEGSVGQDDLNDVVSSIDWIEGMQEHTGKPTIIMGIGYGAFLGFLAAEETAIEGVISIAGYHDPALVFDAIESEKAKDEKGVSERGQQFLISMGCENAPDAPSCLEQLSAQDSLPKDIPVLLIHNASDPVIPADQLNELSTVFNDETTETHLLKLDSSQHDLLATTNSPGFEATMEKVRVWLDEQLNTTTSETEINIVVPSEDAEEEDETSKTNTTGREPIVIEVDPNTLVNKASDL